MLRIENFSQAACERLLVEDYTHFVVRYRLDRGETGGRCNIIIFEPVQEHIEQKSIPIRQVMSLPDTGMTRYYLMLNR